MRIYDTSALVAFLRGEPGADVVDAALREPGVHQISAVNEAELRDIADRLSLPTDLVLPTLEVVPFTAEHARLTAQFYAKEISLADRCCLATAVAQSLPTSQPKGVQPIVYTGDRLWVELFGERQDVWITLIR